MAGGLLERDEPLDALLTAVTDAATGQGSVVLVTGEAGIGKTSLVSNFLDALNSPARVLVGGCDDLSTPRTLGPLRDATQGTRGPLERALADGSSEAVFAAAIEELTGPPPTVLIVEDLHWADDATLDVLGYLGRRVSSLAAMLVLTFRDEEVSTDHTVARMLGVLTGIRVHRLALRPLSPAAVATLAAGTPRDGTARDGPARDGPALHALTGGNPFYVTEALAAGSEDIPATVGDAVLARSRHLSADVWAALEQLSVVPGQVGFGLAEAVLGDRLDFLAETEQHGILEVRDEGLAFRHELARRAVERSLPVIRRRAANRAVVEALRAAEVPDLDRLVHHAVEGGAVDALVTYAPRAGRVAARAGSHRQALAHFEAALHHADRLPAAERARVIDDYAWELYHAHRFADAVHAGRDAVARYTELGDPIALGEAMVRLAMQTLWAGQPDEAIAAIERALRVLEPAGSLPTLAYAATYRGVILAMAELSAEAAAALQHAHRLAVDAGRPDLVSLCLNYLGLSHPTLDSDERIQHLRDSLDIAMTHGLHECTADAYTHLAELRYWFLRWEEVDDCLEAGARFTSERGLWSNADHLETYRCLLLMRRGDWSGAQTGFEANRRRAHDTEVLHMVNEASCGRIGARRGSPEAESMVVGAWQRARGRPGLLLALAFAGLAYAEWAWLTGQPQRAAEVQEVWAPYAEHPVSAAFKGELLRYAARAGLPAEPFDGCPEPYRAGLRGDWRAAADAWERLGDPYERALELAESGAAEPTVEALRILDDLGASAPAALVRRRLKDLGVRRVPRGPASRTRANPAGLTGRRAEVLALLADGLTNAEIAQRLVLSVRTVDHHVAAILTKLGVSSRRQAVVAAQLRQ